MHVGSSPLARGLLCGSLGGLLLVRIIPARAGFTPAIEAFQRFLKDHPRSRGVYKVTEGTGYVNPGSSPLARGLRRTGRACLQRERIIPARAGFTCPCFAWGWGVWDHPRSRGVYAGVDVDHEAEMGSSPLARGLPDVTDTHQGEGGIIPARAGFTKSAGPGPPWFADHPRSRGVYGPGSPHRARPRGSSPLARGLHRVRRPRPVPRRIIPARAGFTSRLGRRGSRVRDHPRSRGARAAGARAASSSRSRR